MTSDSFSIGPKRAKVGRRGVRYECSMPGAWTFVITLRNFGKEIA
jgi:hypothetical protein